MWFSHPKKVCMTYFQHCKFAIELSGLFAFGAVTSIIHAFFPDIFITSASDMNEYIRLKLISSGCR